MARASVQKSLETGNSLMNLTLVVTYGRTGSTLLMRILGQHPNLLVRNRFPFEARTSQYLFLAQRFGVEPLGRPLCYDGATYEPAGDQDDTFRRIALEAVKSARFPTSMRNAYRQIGESENRLEPVAIVEKASGLTLAREILDEFPSFRAIALIRDPRATVRSIRAFNQRRGFLSFGEEVGYQLLMTRVVGFTEQLLRLYKEFSGRSLVVRYEDLMGRPAWVAEELLKLHDLPTDEKNIQRMISVCSYEDDLTRAHRTSDAVREALEDQPLSHEQADRIRAIGY